MMVAHATRLTRPVVVPQFIALGGVTSILSITAFAGRIAYVAIRPYFREGLSAANTKESAFFRTQLGAYAACLLFANLLSNAAGVIDFHWSSAGGIVLGTFIRVV